MRLAYKLALGLYFQDFDNADETQLHAHAAVPYNLAGLHGTCVTPLHRAHASLCLLAVALSELCHGALPCQQSSNVSQPDSLTSYSYSPGSVDAH